MIEDREGITSNGEAFIATMLTVNTTLAILDLGMSPISERFQDTTVSSSTNGGNTLRWRRSSRSWVIVSSQLDNTDLGGTRVTNATTKSITRALRRNRTLRKLDLC